MNFTDTQPTTTDPVAALITRQAESEQRRFALQHECSHLQSIRRPMTGAPVNDDADSVYNAGIDKKVAETEIAIQKCVDDFNDLQVKINELQKKRETAELMDCTPSGDAKRDSARLKELQRAVKDAVSKEDIDRAQRAAALWEKKCRLRLLYEKYGEIAVTLGPVLQEIMDVIQASDRLERGELSKVGTAVCNPLEAVHCLPKVFFPPEVYELETQDRFADGSHLYLWYPIAHD